jgi:uncharacterized MAPEG superfamily protein
MTLAYWCILIAAVMPIFWAAAAKAGGRDFSNARPRDYLGALTGWRQRANWAQENSYEAFPPFAAAVIVAHLAAGAGQSTINALALTFVVARLVYGICYIADRSTLRSFAWLAGFAAMIALFVTAA